MEWKQNLLTKLGFMQFPSPLFLHRMCSKCGLNLHEHKILMRMSRKRTVITISVSLLVTPINRQKDELNHHHARESKHVRYSCGFLFCLPASGDMTTSYRTAKAAVTSKIIAVDPWLSKKLEQTHDLMFRLSVRQQTSNYTKIIM